MLSEDRLSQIACSPENHDAKAVVQSPGERYVEDVNAAMIWPVSFAERATVKA